jgi:hypothetical protein
MVHDKGVFQRDSLAKKAAAFFNSFRSSLSRACDTAVVSSSTPALNRKYAPQIGRRYSLLLIDCGGAAHAMLYARCHKNYLEGSVDEFR